MRLYPNKSLNNIRLSDVALVQVDGVLALLKKENIELFQVIKWRYAYNENYREIVKRLGKRSPKIAGKYLFEAESRFEKILCSIE